MKKDSIPTEIEDYLLLVDECYFDVVNALYHVMIVSIQVLLREQKHANILDKTQGDKLFL